MRAFKKGDYVIVMKPVFVRKKDGRMISIQNRRFEVIGSIGCLTYCDIGCDKPVCIPTFYLMEPENF